MKKLLLVVAILICPLSNDALFGGDPVVLVDRMPNVLEDGWANQEAPDFVDLSSYIVVDVAFDTHVTIDSVSTYFDDFNDWTSLLKATAVLNIFADPLTMANDPTLGLVVPVEITSKNGIHTVTASALDLDLAPGTYWIGLTPQIGALTVGQNFNLRSLDTGYAGGSRWRNPSGFFGNGSDWLLAPVDGFGDVYEQRGSITITGHIGVVTEMVNGDLTIFGSCLADDIIVTQTSAGTADVTTNGATENITGINSITILGSDGDDEITVEYPNVVIMGENGNDTITVNGRNQSQIFGGAGDDNLIGSFGRDIIEGGLGYDIINGRNGNDTIHGCEPGVADTAGNELRGGRGSDEITGTDFVDIILGSEGHDTIYGLGGNDDIKGGLGRDTIFGGAGDDTIAGGDGYDELHGEGGNDTINGGDGQDILHGGADNDVLSGNKSHDILNGDGGDDTFTGGEGNDTFNGGAGFDTATDTGENGETSIEG